jgi:hypothetical protein
MIEPSIYQFQESHSVRVSVTGEERLAHSEKAAEQGPRETMPPVLTRQKYLLFLLQIITKNV